MSYSRTRIIPPVQPPESLSSLAEPIYETFYGLKEQPFAISTDPKFLFLSAAHRRAYEELLNGLVRDESVLLLTGETGSGKTTLCRAVIGALGERTFSSILHQPYMTGPEMLRLILRDFGLVSREELRRGVLASADVPQLLDALEGFLRSLVSIDSRAVVVIDEAQSLSPTLLDEVRMLTAFERDGRRLIQIVLCGQPMLLNTLKTEPMYALNERITRRVALMPLSKDEVEQYIHHRLAIAGGTEAVAFQPEALRLIAELSRGLPRRVNVLCDRTLQEGRVESERVIGVELVKRAAKSLAGAHAMSAPASDSIPSRPAGGVIAAPEADIIRVAWWKRPAIVGPIAGVVLAVLGLWWYASSVVDASIDLPAVARLKLDVGQPPARVRLPSEAELNLTLVPCVI
jgi:general secretion pathway protein A